MRRLLSDLLLWTAASVGWIRSVSLICFLAVGAGIPTNAEAGCKCDQGALTYNPSVGEVNVWSEWFPPARHLDALRECVSDGTLLDCDTVPISVLNEVGRMVPLLRSDQEFQDRLLEKLYNRVGIDVDPREYASLYDLVRVDRGEVQRYGSFIESESSVAPGNWVNGARENLGLGPREEQHRKFSRKVFESKLLAGEITIGLSSPSYPSNPSLRRALIELAEEDQRSRSSPHINIQRADRHNLATLKALLGGRRFPTRTEVGLAGQQAAWLLVQHATSDVEFMERALDEIATQVENGDFSRVHYALLVDRTRLARGFSQVFGTQSTFQNGVVRIAPVDNVESLEARRQAMMLPPLSKRARVQLGLEADLVDPESPK